MTDHGMRELERRWRETGSVDDESALNRALLRAGLRPTRPSVVHDMEALMVNKDKPGRDENGWEMDPHEALRHHMPGHVDVLLEESEGGYEGSVFAVLRVRAEPWPYFVLWSGSFGSCSGCDALQGGQSTVDYIKATLREGNSKQFWTLGDAAEFLRTTDDYTWGRSAESVDLADKVASMARGAERPKGGTT